MAHFMKTFRKNRKVMLAVLTLLAMLSFVFVPTLMEIMETRGGGRRNPVVVTTTKYGSLKQAQLDQLLSRRQRLYAFFQQTAAALQRKGGRGGAVSQALDLLGNAGSEEAAVQDWLQTRKAEQLGLKVSQSAINAYLAALTEGKLGDNDIREILGRLHISQPQLFESLRQELLSFRLLQMFGDSLGATTPDQRWGYFRQLNRRAKIEAVPVAAMKFVDKIQDPSPDALREFFDKHKDKLADLDSPEPGFREPHRIDVEYLKATVETFMNPAAVTEEAIREYYEANKDRLYKDMLPEGPVPAAPKADAPKPDATKGEPAKSAGPGKEAPKAEATKSEPPKAEAVKPAPAKVEPPKTEAAKPAPAKTESPKTEDLKGTAAPPAPDKKSSAVRRSPFRLVSEQKTVPASASKGETGSPKSPPAPAKVELAAPAPPSPAPKVETLPTKVEAPVKPAQAPAKQPPAMPELKSMPGAIGPSVSGPVKYKPLADVKDEIRKTLARQAAQETVRDVIRKVQDKLTLYATKWTNYETAEPQKKASMTPPARPDFVALAKEHRLTAAQTGLVSALQMAGTDIGKSRQEGSAAFTDVAFGKGTPLFLPGTSQDIEGNSYIYWKVNDSPERVPELDEPEVRQHVLNTWKLIQARELASKEAERLAAEARNAKKSLAEVLAGRKDFQVLSPPPFTWLTFGNLPWYYRRNLPTASSVEQIPGAKTEFMRTVFDLKAGDTGVGADQSKSTFYAVRVVEFTPGDSVLWDMFVTDDYRTYAMAGGYDQQAAVIRWREGMKAEAGLHWEREPVRGRDADAED